MFLLSSGKSTIISEFGSLENRVEYKHQRNGRTDFQFFPRELVYAELSKKDRVEILRIKEENTLLKIRPLKKIKDKTAACIACPKSHRKELALGMGDGKIKLYDLVRSETMHLFPADAKYTCVNHLDYNASDEYLSAVFVNGLVSIFGIKTKVKLHMFSIDGESALTRFHPFKRSLLSIASYKGNVTIYDIDTRRSTSHHTGVHTSPCSDLCMTESRADTLISVGFDCLVNIFDIRRKLPVATFFQDHPLSAGAISGCGNYFCVGNLKGELLTYDIRKMKKESVLSTRKVHDGLISRIVFFSTPESEDFTSNFLKPIQKTTNENTSYKTAEADLVRSFGIDINRRYSFSTDHSDFFDRSDPWILDRKKNNAFDERLYAEQIQNENNENTSNTEENVYLSADSYESFHESDPILYVNKHNAFSMDPKLYPLRNETKTLRNETKTILKPKSDRTSKSSGTQRSGVLSTTPIEQRLAEINARLDKLESELKFQMETNKWQTYTQMFNLWTKLNNNDEAMCEALEVLLHTDPFVNEFLRLRKENEMLKKELQKYSKK